MPVEYQINRSTKRITTKCRGKILDNELLENNEMMCSLFSKKVLDDSWQQLVLFENASYGDTNLIGFLHQLSKLNPWPASCLRAVVTHDNFIFGICRIFQQVTDPNEKGIRVFKNREDAEAYLSAKTR